MSDKEKTKKEGKETNGDEVQSYSYIRGEWEERKLSFLGVVKGFVSQLKVGQDLTKVSLPCVFLRPYSLLEEVAARNFAFFELLFEVQGKSSPLKRMLAVLKWLIATAKQEHFNHKPFNPVIGEVNRCSYVHDTSEPKNTTYFIVEQVKHHPPTCGIRIDNPYHNITVEGFYTFQVQFNKNSVTVANNGRVNLQIGSENYWMPKAMPDMMIKNVILGSKLVVWEGPLSLHCKETGLKGEFELYTKDRTNMVKGKIFNADSDKEPLVFVDGKCGGPANWRYNLKHPSFASQELDKKEKKDQKKKLEKEKLLVEPAEERKAIQAKYPKSQEENSSINIWAPVRKCIIANEMDKGDVEKQQIEDKQRTLLNGIKDKGETFEPVYFDVDEEKESWKIKDVNWWKDYKP